MSETLLSVQFYLTGIVVIKRLPILTICVTGGGGGGVEGRMMVLRALFPPVELFPASPASTSSRLKEIFISSFHYKQFYLINKIIII